jgi:Recombination endonuclease VII
MSRICTKCRQEKPDFCFQLRVLPTGTRTRRPECTTCKRQRERDKYTSWSDATREISRVRRYGLTPLAFAEMLQAQEYKCGCCRDPLPNITKHVHIDHDHKTGRVRGVVCRDCNMALGYGRDDPTRLRMAAEYLERHTMTTEIAKCAIER